MPVCCFLLSLSQISYRVRSFVQSGVRAERVHRPVYSPEVRTPETKRPATFLSAYPIFRELLRCSSFSEAVPKLWRHGRLLLRRAVCELTACCFPLWTAAVCIYSAASHGHLCWHQVSRHVTPTLTTMELFIQREPIYTIYTLVCISSFITFCIDGD